MAGMSSGVKSKTYPGSGTPSNYTQQTYCQISTAYQSALYSNLLKKIRSTKIVIAIVPARTNKATYEESSTKSTSMLSLSTYGGISTSSVKSKLSSAKPDTVIQSISNELMHSGHSKSSYSSKVCSEKLLTSCVNFVCSSSNPFLVSSITRLSLS